MEDLLETREARQHPIEFEGPAQYRDSFDIELPEGYEVDALPDPTKLDIGVATYESKRNWRGECFATRESSRSSS